MFIVIVFNFRLLSYILIYLLRVRTTFIFWVDKRSADSYIVHDEFCFFFFQEKS